MRDPCDFCPCACCTKGELMAEAESARAGESAALEEVARLRARVAELESAAGFAATCSREIVGAERDAARAEAERLRARVAELEAYQSDRAAELDRLHEQLRQVRAGQVAASKRVVELEEEVGAWRDDAIERGERQ